MSQMDPRTHKTAMSICDGAVTCSCGEIHRLAPDDEANWERWRIDALECGACRGYCGLPDMKREVRT